jgi:Zn-finger nucleic acid-binding protein
MNCPFDGATLQVVNRSGIEIDWCPECRGVWLERGELDQLIDRLSPGVGGRRLPVESGDQREDRDDRSDRGWTEARDPRKRRRGGLLAEIFDF